MHRFQEVSHGWAEASAAAEAADTATASTTQTHHALRASARVRDHAMVPALRTSTPSTSVVAKPLPETLAVTASQLHASAQAQ